MRSSLPGCPADRKSGGVGDLKYPLVADLKKEIRWGAVEGAAQRWKTGTGVLLGGACRRAALPSPATQQFNHHCLPTSPRPSSPLPRSEAYGVLSADGIALRGLFLIDKEGVVQHSTINNLAFGRNVDETLRTLQALQYVQEHPDEVCPAGWKPGERRGRPGVWAGPWELRAAGLPGRAAAETQGLSCSGGVPWPNCHCLRFA